MSLSVSLFLSFILTEAYLSHRTSCVHSSTPEACVNGDRKHPTSPERFSEQISSWADTQYSVNKVLRHLTVSRVDCDTFLDNSVNQRFLDFHHDITDEFGTEEKQHSWAVIEKREEIIIYGPFYPNYNNGQHSEDIIIKQTQELLESDTVSEDWKVYVFTRNSPCLARNSHPCMLKLVQKAQEWWSLHGVKTHIGYLKCWGFKGTKENLFRDINFSQVNCIDQNENHESYVKTAEETAELSPVCENLFAAVKNLLRSASFPSINIKQGLDWKCHFKSMLSISPEDKNFTQEANGIVDAALALLSEKSGSYEECLEEGQVFASNYAFRSDMSDATREQIRLAFQRCWKEMLRDKYAELIRERLTEDFNQSTVQIFIKDVVTFTRQYLQIGRIQFPEEDSKLVK